MSVDYYMACTGCHESIHVAQDGMSGFSFYSGEPECMKALNHFLSVHTVCNSGGKIVWINEHQESDREYKQVEWTPKR
jgi:hypothetical protein